ncbi:hypothetical protein BH18ACT9_BH18ACT9_21590 [soil metagenome]
MGHNDGVSTEFHERDPASEQGAPSTPDESGTPPYLEPAAANSPEAQSWPPPASPSTYPAGGFGFGFAPPASQTLSGRLPGWHWPVIAAMALVVGLLGGTLAGVAVSRSLGGGSIDLPILGANGASAPAIEAVDGSVAAVAQTLLPSTVQILASGGADDRAATGSGFVLDQRGHVITNNHVVSGATGSGEIEVVDNDGTAYNATIVGSSRVYDIAVLDVEKPGALPPAALGSSRAMRVGDPVVAIGSPLGLSSTVTSGIVSAVDRPVTTGTSSNNSSFINAVQTDAAINPGNSGGPLVNLQAEVVGVNSAIATTGGPFAGESGNIGVGFAIPMEQVQITATQILATGEARYPVIGANVNTGARGGDGAEVIGVPGGTPADAAGLREGDLVVAVDDMQINDGIGLIVAIRTHQPGESVLLTVRRDGDEKTLEIRLDAKVG